MNPVVLFVGIVCLNARTAVSKYQQIPTQFRNQDLKKKKDTLKMVEQ